MTKRKGFSVIKKIFAIVHAVFFNTGIFAAHYQADTSKKPLPAALEKKNPAGPVIKEANVIFPAILSGNEEQSLDYVEKFSENRRAYLIRTYNKGQKLFPQAAAILKLRQLPQELKVLLALESAFRANAVSKAGAVGYWQFMDKVAREYGLKIVHPLTAAEKKKLVRKDKKKAALIFKAMARQRDDRKNFIKSTHAAARYLQDRSRNLNNDILLMVASYNCGVGNVWDAIAASGKSNPTFWDIKSLLPAETRSYVMNFIALNVIYNNYDKFSNNTLAFRPVTRKADNFETNVTEELGQEIPRKR